MQLSSHACVGVIGQLGKGTEAQQGCRARGCSGGSASARGAGGGGGGGGGGLLERVERGR